MPHFQNFHSYKLTYPLQQHKHKHKDYILKCQVLHLHIPSTTTLKLPQRIVAKILSLHLHIHPTITQTYTQSLVSKILGLTCVHTLYNNTCLFKKACCNNAQSYLLHILHNNNNITHRHDIKMPSLTCGHTLYINTSINNKAC